MLPSEEHLVKYALAVIPVIFLRGRRRCRTRPAVLSLGSADRGSPGGGGKDKGAEAATILLSLHANSGYVIERDVEFKLVGLAQQLGGHSSLDLDQGTAPESRRSALPEASHVGRLGRRPAAAFVPCMVCWLRAWNVAPTPRRLGHPWREKRDTGQRRRFAFGLAPEHCQGRAGWERSCVAGPRPLVGPTRNDDGANVGSSWASSG